MIINSIKKAQIEDQSDAQIKTQSGAQVRASLFDKAPTIVLIEYFNYSNVFSAENKAELLKYIRINDYVIMLEENK